MRVRPALIIGLQDHAQSTAAKLGHRLAPWERETPGSSVAPCEECGLYACAETQPEEDGPIFGSAVLVRCEGPHTLPAWAPERMTA